MSPSPHKKSGNIRFKDIFSEPTQPPTTTPVEPRDDLACSGHLISREVRDLLNKFNETDDPDTNQAVIDKFMKVSQEVERVVENGEVINLTETVFLLEYSSRAYCRQVEHAVKLTKDLAAFVTAVGTGGKETEKSLLLDTAQ